MLDWHGREGFTVGSSNRVAVSRWLLVVLLLVMFGVVGKAWGQCGAGGNAIVVENCLAGSSPSEWDLKTTATDDSVNNIQGFATDISVNAGSPVNFKIMTTAAAYTIDIYRMGYYGGLGARKVASITPSVPLPQTQPACFTDATVGLMDCGNWAVSATWTVPATAVSGIYFAHLVRTDTQNESHIVFVVRNDTSHSAILFQTSDETWQAYNYYGGGSLYGANTPVFNLGARSYKVSYNRPFYTRGFQEESDTFAFGAEGAMVRWLEQNGYDVTYFTGVDAARSGALIKNHKVYMDVGHDEYWTGPHRTNVEAARDAGVNLAFFSGNEVFWKTRWENSSDGTNTPYRTLVCYKETLAFQKLDPSDPPTWTGTWRDASFSPPADGGRPENSLTGTIFMVNGVGTDNDGSLQIQVPAADGKMRFWRNTAAANLAANQTYTLPKASLGYEWDEDLDNGFRPAGLFHLSTSTYNLTSDLLLDAGATYGAGTATHHMTMYRAPSGALVFSAGTIDWSWGLSTSHDNPFTNVLPTVPATDPNMQQATVNLLADMGAQPGSLQPGLVPAQESTDTVAPISTITFPAAGATVNTGTAITVTGTATDSVGMVGGVEVSGDNGATWHPATGRSPWSYVWTPRTTGTTTLLSRAVDDSGNLETAHGVNLTVAPQSCPCSIWNASVTPQSVDSGDPSSIEVGVKFRADNDGSVIGVRFYKAAANTGTHIGQLWSSTGGLLGTATFTGETNSGWQQANFPTPIPVSANTTYIISYFAPNGHYAGDTNFFTQAGVDNPPLHALANGVDGGNGVYLYTTSPAFPNVSLSSSVNYWADLVFTTSSTYSLSGSISGTGGAGARITLTGSETLTTTADASGNFSFSGLTNGTYTVAPSNSGVGFTPASRSVTINGAAVSGVTFTAVVTNPLSISGTITSGGGATVNLSGAATVTTTADASGNYSFPGLPNGSYAVQPVKSGYLFNPSAQSVTLSGSSATQVNFQAQVCNCISIWPSTTVPALIDSNDTSAVELGVKFRSDVDGLLTGLRFYKAAANTGTHVGHIWSTAGALLGTVTFTGETASGWQQVALTAPIPVTANTTYIVSYYAPAGHYSADVNYFAQNGKDTPPLHALQNGVDGANGVFLNATGGGFPTSTFNSANYWVDVLFTPGTSYTITGTISGAGGAGATVNLSGASTASTTADASGNFSFVGLLNGAYTVTPAKVSFTFTPASQSVTINNANATTSFTSVASQSFSITGTLSGAGGSGATVSLGGASTATVTANASGVYSFTALANGSYTVTPSKSGFTFTPASTAVTINNANATANFTSTAQTFTLSGAISGAGGSGATVRLTGASTATVTANASGVYSFTALVNGSYTVTPTKTGFTFTPASSTVTINNANATANFASTAVSIVVTPGTLATATVGTAYSQGLTATGGSAPYSFTASALPAALALSSGGVISGTPTSAGSFNVTITATDSNAVTGHNTYRLAIGQATNTINFTQPASPIVYGQTGTVALQATATSNLPVSFSVASGPATVAGSTLTVTGAGTVVVAAAQSGDGNHSAAAPVQRTIVVNRQATTMTVTPSSPSTVYGANVSLAVSVAGVVGTGQPTGTVQLTIDGVEHALTLTNGAAHYDLGVAQPGAHVVTASYSGDQNYLGSTTGSSTAPLFTVTSAGLMIVANDATKVYGTANPMFGGTISGQQNGDLFTESFTTSATAASNAGTYTIVPAVSGANLASYTVNSKNGTLTITQAASTTTLNASSSSITSGQSVTLTAQVKSATTGTPTGNVQFYDGTSLLGTAALDNQAATYTTTALSAGATHALMAVYAGDTNFTGSDSSSVAIAMGALDFSLSSQGGLSQTIQQGGTAAYTLHVAPVNGAYPSNVTFTASGLPDGATATFSPANIAADGGPQTVTLTVQTATNTVRNELPGERLAPLMLALLLLPLAGARRLRNSGIKLQKSRSLLILIVTMLVGLASITGCGFGVNSNHQASASHTVTVTVSSGAVQHSLSVDLILKPSSAQ